MAKPALHHHELQVSTRNRMSGHRRGMHFVQSADSIDVKAATIGFHLEGEYVSAIL